jgi:hypothetical protein
MQTLRYLFPKRIVREYDKDETTEVSGIYGRETPLSQATRRVSHYGYEQASSSSESSHGRRHVSLDELRAAVKRLAGFFELDSTKPRLYGYDSPNTTRFPNLDEYPIAKSMLPESAERTLSRLARMMQREEYSSKYKKPVSVFEAHQLRVAKRSLAMNPIMANMVGMPHDEARAVVKRITGKTTSHE